MNKLNLIIVFAALLFVGSAKAQLIDGYFGAYGIVDPGAISSTSFTLTTPFYATSYTGNLDSTFASTYMSALSPVATSTATISNIPLINYPAAGLGYPLTGATLSDPINGFFVFGAGSSTPLSFNLTAIQAINTSMPTFWGEGTFTQAGFASTPATFQLIINSNIATVTFAATPEPSTWALMLGGLGALAFFARRRLQA